MSSGPSDAVLAVLGLIGELRACGLLAGLEIPHAGHPEARAPALFDGVLAAFLAEARLPGAPPSLPMPPALGDGRPVDLLRLYLDVRSRGGFAAVASWAAVAEKAGLDPALDAAVKLVYAKYLSLLEQIIRKPGKQENVSGSSGNAGHRSNAKKDKFLSPTKDPACAGLARLKRKREVLVGMLNWVGLVAKNPNERWVVGKNPDSHFSMALMLRRQMFANNDSINVPRGSASPQSGLTTEEQALYDGWEDQLSAGGSSDTISRAQIRPCGQADIPEWTGKPSLPYNDPHVLRFLGELILSPESNEALDVGPICKGRPDECNCQLPGSIACVRFHVTEKKIKLKRELGSAFYAMGLDCIGEDAALTWTKDEEKKFSAIIQQNLPSSKYNFWDQLYAVFQSKGTEGLVSYYHNVFQLRRRAYQNRIAPNVVDSDDDSIEPGFLHLRQDGGQSSSRSAPSSGTQKGSLKVTNSY